MSASYNLGGHGRHTTVFNPEGYLFSIIEGCTYVDILASRVTEVYRQRWTQLENDDNPILWTAIDMLFLKFSLPINRCVEKGSPSDASCEEMASMQVISAKLLNFTFI